jgi:response regulator RpfG family c-di-GMP phosphodiesterase
LNRILAYCGFLENETLALPQIGVNESSVQVLAEDRLRLLWSEVAWPFDQTRLQQSAVEFHQVVHHIFHHAAVVPFRLLSIFEDVNSLQRFTREHAAAFIHDLERLRDFVQMEAVIYVIGERAPADASSGRGYLEQKARLQRLATEHAAAVEDAVKAMGPEVRVREVKNGRRIFALVQRGEENHFRATVEGIAVPQSVSRRISGPWPASEFLSDKVKSPETAGRK